MAKALLQFNLVDEQEDFENAMRGSQYRIVIEEHLNWLRSMVKYQDKDVVSVEECREHLRGLLDDYDLPCL